MPKEEAPKAPRGRKVSIPLTEIIELRDELLAIDVSQDDGPIHDAIVAVADKLLAKVS